MEHALEITYFFVKLCVHVSYHFLLDFQPLNIRDIIYKMNNGALV